MDLTCHVCLGQNSQLQMVHTLCFGDATIQRFHLRSWMKICGNCIARFDQFAADERPPKLTWRNVWRQFYSMQADEDSRQYENMAREFEAIANDFFDNEEYSSWRRGWDAFKEEFSNIMNHLLYVEPEWD